jgi:hypothetical protein
MKYFARLRDYDRVLPNDYISKGPEIINHDLHYQLAITVRKNLPGCDVWRKVSLDERNTQGLAFYEWMHIARQSAAGELSAEYRLYHSPRGPYVYHSPSDPYAEHRRWLGAPMHGPDPGYCIESSTHPERLHNVKGVGVSAPDYVKPYKCTAEFAIQEQWGEEFADD